MYMAIASVVFSHPLENNGQVLFAKMLIIINHLTGTMGLIA